MVNVAKDTAKWRDADLTAEARGSSPAFSPFTLSRHISPAPSLSTISSSPPQFHPAARPSRRAEAADERLWASRSGRLAPGTLRC